MEIITITVIAFVSILILPIILIVCADTKDSSDGEPELKSHKKKGSSKANSKRNAARSNDSIQRKSKADDKEEVTVFTNGPAVAAYEEVGGPSEPENVETGGNTYSEPEILKANAQQINSVLTNAALGGPTSPVATVVNETSPASSQRSSRTSGGQPRVVSQDRALPEIPGPSSRHSVTSERSPSTKRALPELPPPAGDEANLYDQLERDLPPNQIRSKGSSESSSIKLKLKLPLEGGHIDSVPGDDSEEMLIEPDEVTRSSVFMSPIASDPSSMAREGGDQEKTGKLSPDSATQQESTKQKVKVKYSKVNKGSRADKDAKSPGSESLQNTYAVPAEPIYAEAPPVPAKLYDINVGIVEGDAPTAAASGVVVDENAQDSGSGYYAVTDDGPTAPNAAIPAAPRPAHTDLPENYNVLTARESIAMVRARQVEEDYYETMDEKPNTAPAVPQVAAVRNSSPAEIYDEIDNQPSNATPSTRSANSLRTPSSRNRPISDKEELYAEIDSPRGSATKLNGAAANVTTSDIPDPGYEKVNFGEAKGEQMDSAGYAIVKESNAAAAAASIPMMDEDDYAECDPIPTAGQRLLPPAAVNGHLSRNGSDLSDYATVSDGNVPQPPVPNGNVPQPPVPNSNEGRPYQRYRRQEHLYQEIDEVRMAKSPPDKKN